jgi:hypothetical protein
MEAELRTYINEALGQIEKALRVATSGEAQLISKEEIQSLQILKALLVEQFDHEDTHHSNHQAR